MSDWSKLVLPDAYTRVLTAQTNGVTYEVRVWCPPNTADATRLPMICVLDGRDFFGTFVDSVKRLARRPDATNVQPAIVVAVAPASHDDNRHRRFIDYTPGPPTEEMAPRRESGGADRFLRFLREELTPLIEHDFSADPNRRILFGHSLAGFFTLHTLATAAASFATYVAVSPSIWWNEAALHSGFAQLALLTDRRIFIAVGEWEGQLPPWQKQHANAEQVLARRRRRAMIERAQAAADELERVLGRDNIAFHEFADEDHASVVLVAVARALRFSLGTHCTDQA